MTSAADHTREIKVPNKKPFFLFRTLFDWDREEIYATALALTTTTLLLVGLSNYIYCKNLEPSGQHIVDTEYDKVMKFKTCYRATSDRTACWIATYHWDK